MARRKFPLEPILFCAAAALGRRGACSSPPDELHKFLTRSAPDWSIVRDFEITAVTSGLALLRQHPRLRIILERSLQPIEATSEAFDNDKQFKAWIKSVEKELGETTLHVTSLSSSELRAHAYAAQAIARRNLERRGSWSFGDEY